MANEQVEIIARGVLIWDSRILLCRNRKQGHSFLPGGHVEFGEPASRALEREIMEETGLSMQARQFLGACESWFIQKGSRHHEVNLVFRLQAEATALTDPVPSLEDNLQFIWVSLAELRGQAPRVVLMPPGILNLATRSAPEGGSSAGQGGAHGEGWISDWY